MRRANVRDRHQIHVANLRAPHTEQVHVIRVHLYFVSAIVSPRTSRVEVHFTRPIPTSLAFDSEEATILLMNNEIVPTDVAKGYQYSFTYLHEACQHHSLRDCTLLIGCTFYLHTPNGTRTRIFSLRTRYPNLLDDGGILVVDSA